MAQPEETKEEAVTRRGRVTIAHVAERSAVSPATVSRVMNGRFAGIPGVAERVRAVADELGYAPSHLARALALGQTQAIAFVVPDLGNPAFQQVLSGLSKAAALDGHRVLVADSAESVDAEPSLALETRRRCDALVLCAPRMAEERLLGLVDELKPVVLLNRTLENVGVPCLSIDYGKGIRGLADHLYALGHRRIAYLGGAGHSVSNRRRLRALDEFETSVDAVEVLRLTCGVSTDAGHEAAEAVMDTGATAVLAFNDLVAVGLVHRLAELGVRVPDDISVTGFDDIPFARFNVPPLTTASVPYEELGREAWNRLQALINGDNPGPETTYAPELVLRGSSARPR